MSIFSYHLVELSFLTAVKGILSNPTSKNSKGIVHSEYMTAMTLGSPILSPSRLLLRQVAVFVQWENEKALDAYLENDKFDRILAKASCYTNTL